MVSVENDHLGGAAGLAARFDDAGEGVVALHEGDRSGGGAAAGQELARGADVGEVGAGAAPVLEEHPLGAGQPEDGVHRVLDGVDEARRALRVLFHADVEPHRRVEGGHLVEEEVGQLVPKRVPIGLGGEVAPLAAPAGHGADDAADELADGGLTPGRVEVAAEVLGDDDVRGHLGPELRHLDVFLLEDDLALLIADDGGAHLPLAGVVGIDSRFRVEALDGDAACSGFLPGGFRLRSIRSRPERVSGQIDGRHDSSFLPAQKRPSRGALGSNILQWCYRYNRAA